MADNDAVESLSGMCALCISEFEGRGKRFGAILDSYNGFALKDNILHFSVSMGHLHCVNVILDSANVDINQTTKGSGQTPLMVTAKKGNTELLKALITKGADVCALDDREEDALMFAVGANHCDCAKILLKEGAVLDKRNKFHRSPLIVATDGGSIQCMRLLIEHGAKFDLFGPNSAMSWVMFGLRMCTLSPSEIEAILMLIVHQEGAINMHLFEGIVHKSCPDLLRSILDKGITIKGNRGEDNPNFFVAIVRAIENGFTPNVRLLLEYQDRLHLKLNDHFRDVDGKTLLQIACEQNIDDIVEALLEHGADPDLLGLGPEAQRTPLFVCLRSLSYNEYGLEFISALIQHGCEVDKKCVVNLQGVVGLSLVTPLDYSLYGRNLFAAQILLEAGASICNYDREYNTHRSHKRLVHKKLESTQQEVNYFVKSHLSGPLPLYNCTRKVIRIILGSKISSAIKKLPLAPQLQEFVSYYGINQIAKNFKKFMLEVGIQPCDDMTELSIESDGDSDSLESDMDFFDISDETDDSDDEDYLPSVMKI